MKTLEELKQHKDKIIVFHYACTDVEKSPVIITNISIKEYSTGQIISFSLAEYKDEKTLLTEFIKHMKKYSDAIIITWNQKSTTYGIQQMQQRCKELEIDEKIPIRIEQLVDLDDIFTKMYGRGYVDHPKLRKLAEVNNITLKNFVEGEKEIQLYYQKEYKKIENSTNRKVSVIADYLSSAFEGTLKVGSSKNEKKTGGKKQKNNNGKSTKFWLSIVGLVLGIIVSGIFIFQFVEDRLLQPPANESTERTQEIDSSIQPQTSMSEAEPFLSLQIVPHTDAITERAFPAIIFGNGSVQHKPSKVESGPVIIYENLTSSFSVYVHNEGPGLVSIDRYVVNVISSDKSLQPVSLTKNHLGKILEPGSESVKLDVKFAGNSRMAPGGTIDFEIHHAEGKINKSIEYEYMKERPFDNLN